MFNMNEIQKEPMVSVASLHCHS